MASPTNWSANNNTSPGQSYAAIAVGASVTGGFRALYVGTAGDVCIQSFDGALAGAVFVGAQAGSILPITGIAIGTTASGTTASNLVIIR